MLNDMEKHGNMAIIVAAGSGSRLGVETPKQFQLLQGREILSYSVERFLLHPDIQEVILVTAAAYVSDVSRRYPHCHVVAGGASRQESVGRGLAVCTDETQHVLVHDAARPLLPARVIDDCLIALEHLDGVAPALTPNDSMVLLEDHGFRNLDRSQLRIIQTPQCFSFAVLRDAHASGLMDTDELGLVKQAFPQARLGLVEGVPGLMKITHAEDLNIISQYLDP